MSVATPLLDSFYAEPDEQVPPASAPPVPRRRRLHAVPDALPKEPAAPRSPRRAPVGAPARVGVLNPPRPVAAPVRLTRRGVAVLALAVCALGAVLVGLAIASRPSPTASATRQAARGSAVTVRSGDTLWSIARRVAPAADPVAEVAALQQRNHLGGDATVQPGQVLRVP